MRLYRPCSDLTLRRTTTTTTIKTNERETLHDIIIDSGLYPIRSSTMSTPYEGTQLYLFSLAGHDFRIKSHCANTTEY